jgi:hypothetical protein
LGRGRSDLISLFLFPRPAFSHVLCRCFWGSNCDASPPLGRPNRCAPQSATCTAIGKILRADLVFGNALQKDVFNR